MGEQTGKESPIPDTLTQSPLPHHLASSDSVKLRAGGGLNDHVL